MWAVYFATHFDIFFSSHLIFITLLGHIVKNTCTHKHSPRKSAVSVLKLYDATLMLVSVHKEVASDTISQDEKHVNRELFQRGG